MTWRVRFTPEALGQLEAIEYYIANAGAPENAARFVDAIVVHCESLTTFPERGSRRDDIMRGLRTTNHRGRVVIAFAVDSDSETVDIVGVFYGGQDYESVLEDDTN